MDELIAKIRKSLEASSKHQLLESAPKVVLDMLEDEIWQTTQKYESIPDDLKSLLAVIGGEKGKDLTGWKGVLGEFRFFSPREMSLEYSNLICHLTDASDDGSLDLDDDWFSAHYLPIGIKYSGDLLCCHLSSTKLRTHHADGMEGFNGLTLADYLTQLFDDA